MTNSIKQFRTLIILAVLTTFVSCQPKSMQEQANDFIKASQKETVNGAGNFAHSILVPLESGEINPTLGQGYDYDNDKILNTSPFSEPKVIVSETDPNKLAGKFSANFVSNNQELLKTQNIDFNLRVKYVAFKGSLDFSRKYFFNSSRNSITWGIDYTTFYGKDRLVNPTLSDKQSKLLKSSPEKFISEYGREYVSSKTNGIKISVLYQFESTKKEEVDEMNSSLSAFFKGGSVSAEFESKLKSLYNSQKLNIFLSNQGGGKLPTELAFCELSKVKDILKKYLDDAIAINKSVCLEYSTSYYPGLPDKYKSTEPELTIQEKYYENYYKVNSEKNILYTFVHQIPKPSDAVLNEFKIYDQIDKRDNFIHDMNIAAKNYMLFPNDNTKYSSLDDILKKAERLEQVNLPPLPKIWSVNFSQVLQRGETTVTQTLKNLPQTETINIAMEGGVFPKDASSTGQYEIAFRVYVNDRAVWWDEFHSDPDNNAQKVSRNIPIPYPDNGNAEIRIEYADCIQGQGGGKPFNLGITFSVRQ